MCGSRGYRNIARIGVFALAIVCVCGCGGSGRPKTVKINGKVTINGQAPGEAGKLHFQAIEAAEGYPKRPASGVFDAEGNYRVMSWEPDDGLVPGRYSVSFMPIDLSKTRIPEKYRDGGSSGLQVDVPTDQYKFEYNIDIRRN